MYVTSSTVVEFQSEVTVTLKGIYFQNMITVQLHLLSHFNFIRLQNNCIVNHLSQVAVTSRLTVWSVGFLLYLFSCRKQQLQTHLLLLMIASTIMYKLKSTVIIYM